MDHDQDYLDKLKRLKRKKRLEDERERKKHFFSESQWYLLTAIIGIGLV